MGTGQTVLVALTGLAGLILLVSGILMLLKTRLLPAAQATIDINGKRNLQVREGSNLLHALASGKIYLPSACGGQGVCGLCRCQVLQGGTSGSASPRAFFTPAEIAAKWQLGCQVKVRGDMKIFLPDEILGARKYECTVISNRNIATFIKELVVELPPGEKMDFRPGAYIQADVPAYTMSYSDIEVDGPFREEWDRLNMWKLRSRNRNKSFRAYSLANYPGEGNHIMLNVRISTPPWNEKRETFRNCPPGICSSYLFSLRKGDSLTISGPFGKFFIMDSDREMVYVGGGAGMAPLRSHIFHLLRTLGTDRKISFWYGARSPMDIFYESDFRKLEQDHPNFTFHIAVSEWKDMPEWTGLKGMIHQVLLDEYLNDHPDPASVEYYLCGPPAMTGAVLTMLYSLGVPDSMIEFDDFGG